MLRSMIGSTISRLGCVVIGQMYPVGCPPHFVWNIEELSTMSVGEARPPAALPTRAIAANASQRHSTPGCQLRQALGKRLVVLPRT